MTETRAPANGPPPPVCVHDRCTVGGGHSGPCVPIDPESKGRLDRGLGWIIATIVGIVIGAIVGVIAFSYGILRGG